MGPSFPEAPLLVVLMTLLDWLKGTGISPRWGKTHGILRFLSQTVLNSREFDDLSIDFGVAGQMKLTSIYIYIKSHQPNIIYQIIILNVEKHRKIHMVF